MDQALTNKKFIEQIDDVIETLGGTPVDLELTEDREDDMVSNGVFVDKMDEVIEALGGTPSEIIVGDDKADDMVSDNIFQLKMEDVVKNMSGGGGGGSSDFSTAQVLLKATEGTYYNTVIAFIDEEDDALCNYNMQIFDDNDYVMNVILYKGGLYLAPDNIKLDPPPTYSGDVTYNDGQFMITGDCTITCTGQPVL